MRQDEFLQPEVALRPSGLIALPSGATEDALDDAALAELLPLMRRSEHGWVESTAPTFPERLEAALGRPVPRLFTLEATYPFEWAGQGNLDRRFSALWPTLPGHLGGGAFFEPLPRGPGLEAGIEPHGIVVFGLVLQPLWEAWHAAFLDATRGLPFRRW